MPFLLAAFALAAAGGEDTGRAATRITDIPALVFRDRIEFTEPLELRGERFFRGDFCEAP